MTCQCVWIEKQLCVCSKSLVLNDVIVKLNRTANSSNIYAILISSNNSPQLIFTPADTKKYLLLYLGTVIEPGLKTTDWQNEIFATDDNGTFTMMIANFKLDNPYLWLFFYKDMGSIESLRMSRESAIELYFFLKSILELNEQFYNEYCQSTIKYG